MSYDHFRGHKFRVTLDVYDAGCLPTVLREKIEEVKKFKSATAAQTSAEMAGVMDEFVVQLTNCLAAVERARKRVQRGRRK